MDNLLLLLMERSTKIKDLTQRPILLNESQCSHLIKKLLRVVDIIQDLVKEYGNIIEFGSILEDLYRVACRIEALFRDCTKDDWVHASLWQMDNEEEFRELLEELKCDFDVVCNIFQAVDVGKTVELQKLVDFNPVNVIEVENDRKALEKRLQAHIALKNTSTKDQDFELAKYVYDRLVCRLNGEGGELNAAIVPLCHWEPKRSTPLGKGAHGQVYMTNCFGLDFAMKVFGKVDNESSVIANENFKKEAGILAGLSHPNIVKFICCSSDVNNNEGYFIVMEKMAKSLSDHYGNNNMVSQRSYLVAIDIILQIASGMFYLHDMNVAHRDLKPDNILVNHVNCSKLNNMGYVLVKLADFGISKIEASDVARKPTCGKLGSSTYRAPETFKKQDDELSVNAFKSDVYSFGMLCSYILTTITPFSNEHTSMSTTHKRIQEGKRPELPSNCPKPLASLIETCWHMEPSRRPTFNEICSKLRIIKRNLLQFPLKDYMISTSAHINDEDHSSTSSLARVWKGLMRILMGYALNDAHLHHVDTSHANLQGEELTGLPIQFYDIMVEHGGRKSWKQLGNEYVGMEKRISGAMEVFKKYSIVAIVGMGGMGKTTLAETMRENLHHEFDASIFMSMKNKTSLFKALEELLSKLGVKMDDVKDVAQGLTSLEEIFLKKSSLIVLDDIGSQVQVHQLLDYKRVETFKANEKNRMIITTRDWHLVESLGDVGRVDLDGLNGDEALKLFCIHAFPNEMPPSWDESLAKTIVEACKGLPLSLEVVGASLRGVNRSRMWVRALQRLRRARSLGIENDNQLWECLRISFDDLEKEDKDIFLDICCFFCKDLHMNGISKATALRIWSEVHKEPQESLKRLEDKSLIKVHKDDGILEVHDQLRDMGRMIVESDSNYIGTRWWNIQAATWNAQIQKDLGHMESMSLMGPTKGFKYLDGERHLPKLRLLSYQGIEDLISISNIVNHCDQLNGLIMLCKQDGSFRRESNPLLQIKWHKKTHLRVLMIEDSSTLFEIPDDFGNLRFLGELMLLDCHHLKKLPNTLGHLSSLTTLNLSGCDGLKEIPDTLGSVTSLVNLDLSRCTSLEDIPKTLGKLASLNKLNLTKCQGLKKIPEELGDLSSLTILNLRRCKGLKEIPSSFSKLVALSEFDLNRCKGLNELPKVLGNLTSLKSLDLNGCEGLKGIPKELGNMIALTTLDLSWCKGIKEIPESLGNLTSLTTLDLNCCQGLQKIPEAFGNLISLTSLDLNGCEGLEMLPEALGNLISLTTLDLTVCKNLKELPEALGELAFLKTFKLRCCKGLTHLPKTLGDLTSLTYLDLSKCTKLKELPQTLVNLASLTTLNLSGCKNLLKLPETLGALTSLTILHLSGCKGLTKVPETLGALTSLTTLHLSGCKGLIKVPEVLGDLTSLVTLDLSGCKGLKEVPEALGDLTSLITLDLSGCKGLIEIPRAFSNLSPLTTLNISNCDGLKSIPEGLSRKKRLVK